LRAKARCVSEADLALKESYVKIANHSGFDEVSFTDLRKKKRIETYFSIMPI
jgi:hypothetical protein